MGTLFDDECTSQACVDHRKFLHSLTKSEPPVDYYRFPRRDYRWKIGAELNSAPGVQCMLAHSFFLPDCLGLGPDARWVWQGVPVALMTSATVDILPNHANLLDEHLVGNLHLKWFRIRPRARLKALTPMFGKLSIRLMLELLPTPKLVLRRQFQVGSAKVTVRADLEASNKFCTATQARCSFQIDWDSQNTVKLMRHPLKNVLDLQYFRWFKVTPDSKAVASGRAEVPLNVLDLRTSNPLSSFPARVRLQSIKISRIIADKASKTSPLPSSAYLRASKSIGTIDHICVIPGHWIDPGNEVGAPGEREFNMEIANVLEKQLNENGWRVLRPDRECPHLSWEVYLNWVTKQTSNGIPVLEIHGQGSTADYRGLVLGVIGDSDAPLSRELAKDFGYFQMNWRDLAVPKRGGFVLESFNSDEVLQMSPWHRKWTVRSLATKIAASVERASSVNRRSRGIVMEEDTDDNIFELDKKIRSEGRG